MVDIKIASTRAGHRPLKPYLSAVSLLLILIVAPLVGARDGTLKVKFPTAPSDAIYKSHGSYHRKVLELVLSKTDVDYTIIPVSVPVLPATRVVRYLDANLFNVVVLHTDPHKEAQLIPIRVPMYRGLSGWRLLFIQKQQQEFFKNINNLEQLKTLTAGQGIEWPDIAVLRSAGLSVVTAPHRDNLFKMLNHGRIDYFPRGVFEIWNETEFAEAENIVIESNLMLHYPTAFYMFVSKSEPELAEILEKGFAAALNDGSFISIFLDQFADPIKRANFKQRNIIELDNPTLTPETPLNDKRLWFRPKES